jgi:formylglycine-generating enzyme required for sulfatase activity
MTVVLGISTYEFANNGVSSNQEVLVSDEAMQQQLADSSSISSGSNFTTIVNGYTFTMIAVQGGTFTMGCTSEQGSDCFDSEKPAHSVTLSSYYMGKYEVTQGLYKAVTGSNPSYFKGDDLPVEPVSWEDAQDFIVRLNSLTGKRFRLPTEAEWEFAARGGIQTRNTKYSGAYSPDDCAWYKNNSGSQTHSVGTKKANELGIYDMSGNVWEWCNDWYGGYSNSSQTNPTGPTSGSYRVFRGGSWGIYAQYCRVANRSNNSPGLRNSYLGFRLACSSK